MKFITNSNDLSKYLDISIKKNIQIKDISIDSRTIKKDSLFIGINGENFNGNDYVDEAIHKGNVEDQYKPPLGKRRVV